MQIEILNNDPNPQMQSPSRNTLHAEPIIPRKYHIFIHDFRCASQKVSLDHISITSLRSPKCDNQVIMSRPGGYSKASISLNTMPSMGVDSPDLRINLGPSQYIPRDIMQVNRVFKGCGLIIVFRTIIKSLAAVNSSQKSPPFTNKDLPLHFPYPAINLRGLEPGSAFNLADDVNLRCPKN